MIRKTGPQKYELRSTTNGHVLGTHRSKVAAVRQERAIKAAQTRAGKLPRR